MVQINANNIFFFLPSKSDDFSSTFKLKTKNNKK
jgi:hypothetical protein